MSRLHGVNRWAVRFAVIVVFCAFGVFTAVGSAAADPYPPLLPTGQVPAVATVPAPQFGGPAVAGIRNNADSVIIAPGSYPVQARTGAGPVSETSHHSVVFIAAAGVLLAGVLIAFYAVRRTRRTR